jgi:uncharacterized protein
MHQGARLIFFLATVILCVAIILLWPPTLVVSSAIKVIIFAALITAAFSATLIEHFFTKPTDVVANATAALLLLLPAHDDLKATGWAYWALIAYLVLSIVLASASILLNSFGLGDEDGSRRHTSKILKTAATTIGSFKLVYGTTFFVTLFCYVDKASTEFFVLTAYFLAILLIEPGKVLGSILTFVKGKDVEAVGDVFGVQSRNIFLAKLRPNRRALQRFQSVAFLYKLDQKQRKCLIIDSYLLNEEQWVKLIPIEEPSAMPIKSAPNVVYYSPVEAPATIEGRILGTVVEESTIGMIRFEYASKTPVFQGKLVEVQQGTKKILYQIVQGTTAEEVLERKNKSGAIIGDAAQLGCWNAQSRRFERYGWVPEMNSLILEPSPPDETAIEAGELQIGSIPGTSYPVVMNTEEAITHHLAIFGVTGSGKSVFSRWLLKKYLAQGVLVLCIDNTQEYQRFLPAESWAPILSPQQNQQIKLQIATISKEMDKWPRERTAGAIEAAEKAVCDIFQAAVESIPEGRAGILNIPDLKSTVEGLEYIRLFFTSVFDMARTGAFEGRKACIVLEEAHTLIPEWNFNSGDEKRTHALVNTIAQIALQGRKYSVGLIVIGQRTANVSKTVLTQCNSVIAFQQFDPTGLDFFSHYMGKQFAEGLSVLPSRRAVAVGKAFAAGVPLIFEVPEIAEVTQEGAQESTEPT